MPFAILSVILYIRGVLNAGNFYLSIIYEYLDLDISKMRYTSMFGN